MLLNLIKKYLSAITFIIGYCVGYARFLRPEDHYQIPFVIAIIAFLAIASKW